MKVIVKTDTNLTVEHLSRVLWIETDTGNTPRHITVERSGALREDSRG